MTCSQADWGEYGVILAMNYLMIEKIDIQVFFTE